ncbi:hypothetical protein ACFLRO_00965 [Bacteroidota bacterium]
MICIALILVGSVIALIYGIQLIIIAFQTSILWGLVYLFVPFGALIFVILHWEDTSYSFLRSLLSIPFFVAGLLMMPGAPLM